MRLRNTFVIQKRFNRNVVDMLFSYWFSFDFRCKYYFYQFLSKHWEFMNFFVFTLLFISSFILRFHPQISQWFQLFLYILRKKSHQEFQHHSSIFRDECKTSQWSDNVDCLCWEECHWINKKQHPSPDW